MGLIVTLEKDLKTAEADAFPGHGRQVGAEEEIRCLG